MKTRKWYAVSVKPDVSIGLIIMTDMGYIFEAIYKDDKFFISNVRNDKVYFDKYMDKENIIKWMKV